MGRKFFYHSGRDESSTSLDVEWFELFACWRNVEAKIFPFFEGCRHGQFTHGSGYAELNALLGSELMEQVMIGVSRSLLHCCGDRA